VPSEEVTEELLLKELATDKIHDNNAANDENDRGDSKNTAGTICWGIIMGKI
jgi:hypothetical protein